MDILPGVTRPTERPSISEPAIGGVLWFVLAALLVGAGFFVMYFYPDQMAYEDPKMGHIVGNDASNFLIIAVRGTGFIAAGIVSALFGIGAELRAARGA